MRQSEVVGTLPELILLVHDREIKVAFFIEKTSQRKTKPDVGDDSLNTDDRCRNRFPSSVASRLIYF